MFTKPFADELWSGFPLLTFSLLIFSVCFTLKKRSTDSASGPDGNKAVFMKLLAFAVIFSFALLIRIDGMTLWYFVYKFFPGGGGNKGCCTLPAFLTLPACILIGYFMENLLKGIRKSYRIPLMLLIIVLIFFDNRTFLHDVFINGYNNEWRTSYMTRFLEMVPAPPQDCKCFFVSYDGQKNQ